MIIYAVLTNVPLGKLFIAGVIPGVILVLFLAISTIIFCYTNPKLAPSTYSVSWGERFSSLKGIWPIILIIFCILGAIYLGIATATETAGVGCFVAPVVAVIFFKLRWNGNISELQNILRRD